MLCNYPKRWRHISALSGLLFLTHCGLKAPPSPRIEEQGPFSAIESGLGESVQIDQQKVENNENEGTQSEGSD